MPPFPSLTKGWHDKPYPAIDPTRPALSAKGKTIAVTGGAGSIGGAIAKAFAQAGAAKVAIIGRREESLEKTKKQIESEVPNAPITAVKGDVADASSIAEALSKVAKESGGKIDILVAGAGYLPNFESISKADPGEWWTGFETNAKGAFNTCRAFIPVASSDALLINISTFPIHIPAMAQASGYITSKLAGTKIYETVGVENDNIDVIHLHPGVVYSDINLKSGISAVDSADLPGQFAVWASSKEAEFLRGNPGRFLWVNWDVEELVSRKEELKKADSLVITLNGWPFGQDPNSDGLAF